MPAMRVQTRITFRAPVQAAQKGMRLEALFAAPRKTPRLMKLCALIFSLALFPALTHAETDEGLPHGVLSRYSQSGPNIWQQGPFRINFLRAGPESVPPNDADGNNCPDLIEDMARQLVVAHHIFVNLAGFRSPFASPRYKGLKYILVLVRDRTNALLQGSSGRSYDQMTKKNTLVMAIARDIDPARNATPAHEYFHCIENGLTYFKNAWYYEGMARWAEDAVSIVRPASKSMDQIKKMLDDAAFLRALYASSYKAADLLWRPLADLCGQAGARLCAHDPVLALKYANGAPVMRDFNFSGAAFMAALLEKLDRQDDRAFAANGYDFWSEANQRNAKNDPYILEAVRGLLPQACGKN